MRISNLIPLISLTAVGYSQKDTLSNIVETPLEIAKIVRTEMELTSIHHLLAAEIITDGLPRQVLNNLQGYLQKNLSSNNNRDVSLDPWGNPYQIQIYKGEYELWSNGPDQINDTPDDIWRSLPMK
jgi:hypothetical protein